VTDEQALRETQWAFDGVAAAYDRSNAENLLLCAMRRRARRTVERVVPQGATLLDLGCGPGADAEYFAASGYRVTAIDWSPAMVEETRRRLQAASFENMTVVEHLGIDDVDRLAPAEFDAIYSNFGPLNCVADLDVAARRLAARLRPGGVLIASVIGRVCPWELALYALRGNIRRAAIRFARGMVAVPLEGRPVWMQYYTPAAFARAWAKVGLTRVHVRSLGLLMPPPYLDAFARRHPSLVAALQRLEDCIGRWPIVRGHGDHFLVVLRRT
jgi:SAM-dependent methyltransferase